MKSMHGALWAGDGPRLCPARQRTPQCIAREKLLHPTRAKVGWRNTELCLSKSVTAVVDEINQETRGNIYLVSKQLDGGLAPSSPSSSCASLSLSLSLSHTHTHSLSHLVGPPPPSEPSALSPSSVDVTPPDCLTMPPPPHRQTLLIPPPPPPLASSSSAPSLVLNDQLVPGHRDGCRAPRHR